MEKQENLTIRIPAKLKQEFLEKCREEDKTASQLIREFIRNYLKKK